jgi:hypothetical protein
VRRGTPQRKPAPAVAHSRPRSRFRLIALVLLLISGTTNLAAWGGVATLPDIGPYVMLSAQRESVLASSYLWLGNWIVRKTGTEAAAQSLADSIWGGEFERIRAEPSLAMERLGAGDAATTARVTMTINFWATPLLLLIWAVLYVLRERQVRTFGGR